ncbi:MAG: DUF4394 domain-containing protein [Actinomycetota bacterium]|nr:DUF4394 domain-containing protein [Actinomycetota bacterium]
MSVGALVLALGGSVGTAAAGASDDEGSRTGGLRAIGLTGHGKVLVRFNTTNPGNLDRIGTVDGLTVDTKLVGIDFRVQNDTLYGVGDLGGIYTLETSDADATKVSQLTIPLQGDFFGVDFNPAANALRVISDTGQNLRHSFATTPPGPTTMDGNLNYEGVPAMGVTAAAYTNNDLDVNTATTLYDIDTMLDQVAIQAPANQGDLSPTGKLGVDAKRNAGFDIYSTVDGGTTVDVDGFATLRVNDTFKLYKITLFTGKADNRGAFDRRVTDIAIPLNQR